MSSAIERAAARAAATRAATESATDSIRKLRHERQEQSTAQAPTPSTATEAAARLRTVLRGWRRYATLATDDSLALQARILCADLRLRGFDAAEIQSLQKLPEAVGDTEATAGNMLAEQQWEALIALVRRATQSSVLSVAQHEALVALRATALGEAENDDWSLLGAAHESDATTELRSSVAALQGAYAERFELVADDALAFRLWVPERRTQLKARAEEEEGEWPLYRLSVRPDDSKQAHADGSVGNEETVQLCASVEAWGTFDRRDEVVLTAVASALVDALPASAALPLVARLIERHYEQRTMAACEAQLASGPRGRGAHTVPLRADERLDQEARSSVRAVHG
jgi:hypothetical protein